MTPWLIFVAIVKWTAAIFGGVACAVAFVILLVAVVTGIREMLL